MVGDNTFRTIIKENLENLGLAAADLDASEHQNTPVGAESVAHGRRVLSLFRNRYLINAFVDKWFDVCEGCDDVTLVGIVKAWLRSLWLCHGDALEQQDPDKLLRLSELLWKNTQTPLVFDGNTTCTEWAGLATGANIRWEVIGIIAAIVGTCAGYLDPSDNLFQEHNVVGKNLAKQAMVVSTTSKNFTRKCEALDDLFVWLLYEDATCSSVHQGQHNLEGYRQGGELVSAVVLLKWHQDIEANDKVPFFLAELRKRARANIYYSEIGVASFHGRPARASHHYWNLDPPLDLTSSQLMFNQAELEPVLARLDENGFNTDGIIDRATWFRTWGGFSMIREDILDLSLRRYSRDEILQRAAEIDRKTEEHWQKLPSWIREARHQKLNPAQKPMTQLYMATLRQGTRANELLLQRVLIRRAQASSERLIRVSQTIFKDVLEIGSSRELASKFQLDLSAMFVVHGLRAGTIIATELFKQEQLPVYPANPLLPRAQTIMDLSNFAAKLTMVDPSDSDMYEMSQQGRKMLILILEKILNPKAAEPPVPAASQCPDPQSHQKDQQANYEQMEVDMMGNVGTFNTPYMTTAMPMDFNFAPPDALLANEDNSMFMQWLEAQDWERQGPMIGF